MEFPNLFPFTKEKNKKVKKGAIPIDLTGILLKGRYCIVENIGTGGEGNMYLARDIELGIFRAVKELPIRNKREAGLFRLLNHPSLPQMIDYTERDEYCYIIMEYIQGKTLEQYLEEGYVFSIEEILHIGKVILQVLEYLHSRKPAIYYGDLKPSNLMMTEQKRLYLVDFGSAVFSYHASYKETKGTRGYAAPEQFQGTISAASDFYALGKTLERLCGRKKIPYLFQCPALGKFIVKCCRSEQTKRWQSTCEARDVLKEIHPLKLNLKSILIPTAAALVALVLTLTFGVGRKKLPELSRALAPVTAEYFSMEYRSGSTVLRKQINEHIEYRLQNLQKNYQTSEAQRKILELLAWNGELADRADRAEIYYRQLLTYEPEYTKGYLEYGMFLCRQARYQESRAVYRQWKSRAGEITDQPEESTERWNAWKKEAGIILGRKQK